MSGIQQGPERVIPFSFFRRRRDNEPTSGTTISCLDEAACSRGWRRAGSFLTRPPLPRQDAAFHQEHVAGDPTPGGGASTLGLLADRTRALFAATVVFGLFLTWTSDASAFCGFYVAKADSKLFNKASEVAIARAEDKTVITMANDFKGDVKEFALVVPVPTVLEKAQIHVGDAAVLKHLADYSAPRLVEYFDANPCRVLYPESRAMDLMAKSSPSLQREREDARRDGRGAIHRR